MARCELKTTLTKEDPMKRLSSFTTRLLMSAGLAVVVAFLCTTALNGTAGEETKSNKDSTSDKKAETKKLTGAELYAIHCNRCHPERYATERTAAQWKTIMLHMRVRANLPADQAKLVLKYLQEDSGK